MGVTTIGSLGLVGEEGFFRVKALQKYPNLVYAFTRRRLSDSAEEPEFNFQAEAGKDREHRALLAQRLGIPLEHTVWLDPAEGGPVRWVSEDDGGKGALDWAGRIKAADGLVTESLNLFLCTLFSDNNLVIVLYDPRWQVVGLISVYRSRPSAVRIIEAADLMAARAGSRKEEIVGLIGPSMGPCCYTFADPSQAGMRSKTNLWDFTRTAMLVAGLHRDRIVNPRACTACFETEFFGQEAGGPAAGAIVLGVGDKKGTLGLRRTKLRARMAENATAAAASGRRVGSEREAASGADKSSLLEEEQRLNRMIRCPYGQKKVYVRSVFTGQSAETSEPEIVLRCQVMAYVGQAASGANIVTKEYIEAFCCADYAHCETYRLFSSQQKR